MAPPISISHGHMPVELTSMPTYRLRFAVPEARVLFCKERPPDQVGPVGIQQLILSQDGRPYFMVAHKGQLQGHGRLDEHKFFHVCVPGLKHDPENGSISSSDKKADLERFWARVRQAVAADEDV